MTQPNSTIQKITPPENTETALAKTEWGHAKPWLNLDGGAADGDSILCDDIESIAHRLVQVFNQSPFTHYCGMQFIYENGQMQAKFLANPNLIGNTAFNILHGGVSATILDSLGGLAAMLEIYRANQGTFAEQTKKVQRLATVDLRIDYLAPGRGNAFVATAEVLKLGRKGCTVRMLLVNDDGNSIAHGMGRYAF